MSNPSKFSSQWLVNAITLRQIQMAVKAPPRPIHRAGRSGYRQASRHDTAQGRRHQGIVKQFGNSSGRELCRIQVPRRWSRDHDWQGRRDFVQFSRQFERLLCSRMRAYQYRIKPRGIGVTRPHCLGRFTESDRLVSECRQNFLVAQQA